MHDVALSPLLSRGTRSLSGPEAEEGGAPEHHVEQIYLISDYAHYGQERNLILGLPPPTAMFIARRSPGTQH